MHPVYNSGSPKSQSEAMIPEYDDPRDVMMMGKTETEREMDCHARARSGLSRVTAAIIFGSRAVIYVHLYDI